MRLTYDIYHMSWGVGGGYKILEAINKKYNSNKCRAKKYIVGSDEYLVITLRLNGKTGRELYIIEEGRLQILSNVLDEINDFLNEIYINK